MRIALDINGINHKSGLGYYLRLLVAGLAAYDRANEYILYSHGWGAPPSLAGLDLPAGGNFRQVHLKVPETLALLAEYKLSAGLTERLLAKHHIDVFHGPANIVPLLRGIPSVLTMHHYFRKGSPFSPQNMNRRERFYFSCMEHSIRGASHVACDSESTRRDVAEVLGPAAGRASVIYPGGPDASYRVLGRQNPEISAKYGLPPEFLLFTGPLHERKNLPGLLNALKLIEGELGGHKLVVTGTALEYYPAVIKEQARRLGLADRLVMCGPVEIGDMPWLYNLASALVYPSLFEGFGYPPLEAFQCGCPVAASNATSIPEITGDAALSFDPQDERAMADCILRVLRDEALRKDLTEKGFEQAKKFPWTETVKRTVEIYKKVKAAA